MQTGMGNRSAAARVETMAARVEPKEIHRT
jgi:hypothetical protein